MELREEIEQILQDKLIIHRQIGKEYIDDIGIDEVLFGFKVMAEAKYHSEITKRIEALIQKAVNERIGEILLALPPKSRKLLEPLFDEAMKKINE